MHRRPATRDDIAATALLVARSETFWFGAPEEDEAEIGEHFDHVSALETHSQVFLDGDRIVAVALHNPHDAWFVTDPDPALTSAVADDLIDWYATLENPHIEVLDRDEAMRAALDAHRWQHARSSFELVRQVSVDWTIAEPSYPAGVETRTFTTDDAEAMYRLIYVDAGWAEVPGHPHRNFDEWRDLFITDTTVPDLQVLAWRGERLVGVSTGRIFSDGTGWIAQLAVARDERGSGLGRALLLDGLRRRAEAGATMLGLAVQADNRGALNLYLDTGLQIDREWMEYQPA